MPNSRSGAASTLPRAEFIALIAALMALNALAIDIMLPALPDIGDALDIADPNNRQLVITLYLFGFGAAQLIYGPLSDRFGRRTPLLVGLSLYIVAALAAVFAPSMFGLLAFRLLQGLGAAATRVIALAVVRDRYSGSAMAEVMSLVFLVFMVMPVIAPSMGQVLLFTGAWQAIFAFMALLAIGVAIWVALRLPETLAPENRRPLTLSAMTEAFTLVCTNRIAVGYTLAGAVVLGAMVTFVSTSQQIFVGIYGLGELFPIAFAFNATFLMLGSLLNSRIVARFGRRRISHAALILFTLSSAIWWATSAMGQLPLPVLMVFLAIAMFTVGLSNPNMQSLALDPLGRVAGTASAVFGAVQTVGAALLGLFIGHLFDGTVVPLAAGFAGLGLVAILCFLFAEKGRLFRREPPGTVH